MVSDFDNDITTTWQRGILDKKVVFCTGGTGDICSAQVRALVLLGANACIVGRNAEKAERVAKEIAQARPGSKVLGFGKTDVRNIKDVESAVSTCVEQLGGIDFVIAGAAGNFLAPFLQLSTNAFRTVIDIDLMGAFHAAKLTAPHLIRAAASKTASGRILFVSSTASYTGVALNTHAAVAKSGIDSLSSQLAIELGPRGVTSNVIAPGPIEGTEGVTRLMQGMNVSEMSRKIPSGRLGSLQDIAHATIFLFSQAGNYVNGTTLVVDGAAWRTGGGGIGGGFEYPDAVLSDESFRELVSKRAGKL